MANLLDTLTRLRAVAQENGARWADPVPTETVRATLSQFGSPLLEEIIIWYSVCPPGTCPAPYIRVQDLAYTAADHDEMSSVALDEYPDESSAIVDWFYLSRAEHGGLVIWTPASAGVRPLTWRSEIGEISEDLRFDGGLTELVDLWTQGWSAGHYEVHHDGTSVSFRDPEAEGRLY